MALRSPQSEPGLAPETLAGALASGPLPLAAGLRRANEIAAGLRDLHRQDRVYGELTASRILLTESGARLLPLPCRWWYRAMPEDDVRAFGALLYQMLTGMPAPATLAAADIPVHGARTGPSRLRPASMKLALKCLAPKGMPLSMQQVATELRLLSLLLRQDEANTREGEKPAPAAPPFLVGAAGPAGFPMAQSPGGARPVTTCRGHSMQHWEPGTERNPPAREASVAPLVPLRADSFGLLKATPKAVLQPAGGTCPKCASKQVCVSRAGSRFERMLERWQVPICRCHRCCHRYVVFARLKIGKVMPVGTMSPLKRKRPRG